MHTDKILNHAQRPSNSSVPGFLDAMYTFTQVVLGLLDREENLD